MFTHEPNSFLNDKVVFHVRVFYNNNKMTGVPAWITQSLFEELLEKDFEGFSKITKFQPSLAVGESGIASVMVRVKIVYELDGKITENIQLYFD